ncbi:putative sodium-dependent multivitamin transporter [Eupeodes corollae]|uniref:putative sodium-dependent multivitamin transporter n=1 Tax=Eupeodes corollae TaxID=290404 RepID=UPI0024922479|nr:putative sodium-dependent multivitamin transporter [Eupeodes corollae]
MSVLSIWDYIILVIVLLISAGVGLYYRLTGGKQSTTAEYLLADRQMSIFPIAFSLMQSFMSAITLLGVSMENYQYGTMFVIINFSYVLTTPIAAYLYLPVFYRLETASVYEYLEKRFGYAARLAASLAFSIQMVLYMGIVLYAPSLALEAVTGLDKLFAILGIGIVCTFYSTIGGMKAVIITDVFQSLLMFMAIFSVIICATIKAGNWATIWEVAQDGGRINFSDISIDPTRRHTWWTQIIGGGFTYLSLYGVNQTQVQRLLSVKNLKSAQLSLWWNLPILSLLSVCTCFSGLCMYYYYHTCDPLLEGRINSRDQLLPLFVVDTMGHVPGLAGLFVSGIFCASLSTISSAINALSAVTLEDYVGQIYKCLGKEPLSDKKRTALTKAIAFVYGLICIGLAFAVQALGGVLQASLTIFGVVGGPLLGLFTLGMFTKRANQKGCIIGLILGLAFGFWIGFGQPKPIPPQLPMSIEGCPITANSTPNTLPVLLELMKPRAIDQSDYFYLYRLSYMWYSVLGFAVTFICGYILSLICEILKIDDNRLIYTDKNRTQFNCELFIQPIAKRLHTRNMDSLKMSGADHMNGATNDRTK